MYQEVRINRRTEAGGGVDVGHLLAPLSHACYGPAAAIEVVLVILHQLIYRMLTQILTKRVSPL